MEGAARRCLAAADETSREGSARRTPMDRDGVLYVDTTPWISSCESKYVLKTGHGFVEPGSSSIHLVELASQETLSRLQAGGAAVHVAIGLGLRSATRSRCHSCAWRMGLSLTSGGEALAPR